MELSLLLANQILVQFLMIFVGIILVKIGFISDEEINALSKLVLYVIMPCTIINSFQIKLNKDILKELGIALIVAFLINMLFYAIASICKNLMVLDVVEQASIIYPNCANLIIPLVAATLGEEWQIFCCPYILIQQIIFFTVGVTTIREEKGIQIKKLLLNSNIFAIIIGIFLLISQIRLPTIITSVLNGFAAMIAPSSMMVIGMSIGNVNFVKAFTDKKNYVLCFIRLILMPCIVIVIIKFSGICKWMENLKSVLLIVVMGASASSAAMVTQTARCFGKDSEKASILNMMTVLFLIFTMPIIVMLYEKLI